MKSKTIKEPERLLNIREECDVLVAGAGTAGCVAAIAAARNGARTVLIEQLPLPSGTMTNGGIGFNSFFSSYTEETKSTKRIVKGIAEEITERLIKAGGCPGYIKLDAAQNPHRRPYRVVGDTELYKCVISQMLMEAGVKVYLHTFLSDVITEDGKVAAAVIESKSGREVITAKCFIDCTGDGDLAVKAGAEFLSMHDKYVIRSAGKIFSIGNVDFDSVLRFVREDGMIYMEIYGDKYSKEEKLVGLTLDFTKSKTLSEKAQKAAGYAQVSFSSIHEGTIDYVNYIGRPNVDTTNVEDFSKAEMELHIHACQFMEFLRENIPGFEYAFISHSANQLGIRVSRIVKCDYSITNDEILNSERFDDEIGLYGFHDRAEKDPTCIMKNAGFYGLPYRMLLPVGLKNLFAAGRMLTEEPKAHMSTRNTIACMVQGQAAGTAAAICAKDSQMTRELEYSRLRKALEEGGVHFEPR